MTGERHTGDERERAELRALWNLAVVEETTDRLVAALQRLWASLSGLAVVPNERVLHQMLARYEPTVVEQAVRATAPKAASRYLRNHTDWSRYMWGVCRRATALAEEAETTPSRLLASALSDETP